jgi:hypothetical protein
MSPSDMDTATRERLTEAARAYRILDMEGHGDMTLVTCPCARLAARTQNFAETDLVAFGQSGREQPLIPSAQHDDPAVPCQLLG